MTLCAQELPFVRLLEVFEIVINSIDVFKVNSLSILTSCYEALLHKAYKTEFATDEISEENKQINQMHDRMIKLI